MEKTQQMEKQMAAMELSLRATSEAISQQNGVIAELTRQLAQANAKKSAKSKAVVKEVLAKKSSAKSKAVVSYTEELERFADLSAFYDKCANHIKWHNTRKQNKGKPDRQIIEVSVIKAGVRKIPYTTEAGKTGENIVNSCEIAYKDGHTEVADLTIKYGWKIERVE